MKTVLRIALFLLILILGVSALAIYWTFYKPLPDYSAVVELPGLNSNVDIHWDTFGVPHIYADNEEDLYYAVGYVHAQDRLWQMTFTQIAAEGRFAEFLGEDLIEFDKYQRTLGFWETAERIEQEAPEEIHTVLEAYSRGVNDFVEQNKGNLPVEFMLLGIEPIEWTPTHSYAISRLMAWEMNISWWSKLTYAHLAENLPMSVLQELFPRYDDTYPTMMNEQQSLQAAEAVMPILDTEFRFRSMTGRKGTSVGSNAWAVDGSRTHSGMPILAGDPHMGISMPGHWYEMHQSVQNHTITGATIPGSPVVVLGQNNDFAWSLTNMMADDTDFFLEIQNPDHSDQYLADSLNGEAIYRDYENQDEVIRVKDNDDIHYRFRKTMHGPIITDIYPNVEIADDRLISMKWTGHQVSHEIYALYQINRSENLESFREALGYFHTPGQNFTYADREGNIAIFSAARLPIRDFNPLLFRPGWDPDYDWYDWIDFDEMPRIINPETGYVANANNKLHTDSYPHYIATFWEPPSRIERIEEFLAEVDTVDANIFQQMQFDSYSVHAREIVELILPILRLSSDEFDYTVVAPYLENWDFQYLPESTAASVLDAFFIKLTRNTMSDLMSEEVLTNFMRLENVPVRVMTRLLMEDSFLFNNQQTDVTETRDDIIAQSMQDAIDWLTEQYGPEPFLWRWENLHTVSLAPPLFRDAIKEEDASITLKMIVNNLMSKGPYAAPGHGMSLNKGEYSWLEPFEMTLGPSIRRIVDFSDRGRSHSILPTGQSGNPLSEFFGDQTELWLQGQYRYIYQDSTFFHETSYQTMQLVPR